MIVRIRINGRLGKRSLLGLHRKAIFEGASFRRRLLPKSLPSRMEGTFRTLVGTSIAFRFALLKSVELSIVASAVFGSPVLRLGFWALRLLNVDLGMAAGEPVSQDYDWTWIPSTLLGDRAISR